MRDPWAEQRSRVRVRVQGGRFRGRVQGGRFRGRTASVTMRDPGKSRGGQVQGKDCIRDHERALGRDRGG